MASGHVEWGWGVGGRGGFSSQTRLLQRGGGVTEVEGGCKDEVGVGVE